MPDVNLLKDTERLEPNQPPKPKPTGPGELSSPEVESGAGLSGWFRSLFNRPPSRLPSAPVSSVAAEAGKMSLNKGGAGERILSEKRGRPTMIPLPEEEDNYNVNLLSEDLVSTFNPRQRFIQLGLYLVAAAAVVGFVYAGVVVYQRSVQNQIHATQQELTDVKQRIAALAGDQATITSTTKKLAAIKSLIDSHIYWTNFFNLLQKYTLPTVTYGSSFSADQNGVITLAAKTSSFDEIAHQYLIWQQLVAGHTFISAFTVTGANAQTTKDGTTYSFSATLTLLPTVLTTATAVTTTQP